MTLEIFISILVISATATSVAIEVIKAMLDKFGIKYNSMPIAVVIAFVIGASEMMAYIVSKGISGYTAIYVICTGLANVIGATTSYDTAKALIYALFGKTTE
jgi:hypothetical protein